MEICYPPTLLLKNAYHKNKEILIDVYVRDNTFLRSKEWFKSRLPRLLSAFSRRMLRAIAFPHIAERFEAKLRQQRITGDDECKRELRLGANSWHYYGYSRWRYKNTREVTARLLSRRVNTAGRLPGQFFRLPTFGLLPNVLKYRPAEYQYVTRAIMKFKMTRHLTRDIFDERHLCCLRQHCQRRRSPRRRQITTMRWRTHRSDYNCLIPV